MADADPTVEELARRLARLEAIQAIEGLKYRYWRACDAKDPDGLRDCFVKQGAEIDYGPGLGPFHDREDLVAVYTRLALRREDGKWMFHDIHRGQHPEIELVDESHATGRWAFSFLRVNLADQVIEQAAMEYEDRYVVEDGAWKIQASRVRPQTGLRYPIPDRAQIAPGPTPRP